MLAIADVTLIVSASIIAGIAYHAFLSGTVGDVSEFLAIGIESAVFFVLALQSTACYRLSNVRSWEKHIGKTIIVWSLVLLIVVALLFLLKVGHSYSRGSFVVFAFLGVAFLLASRLVVPRWFEGLLARGALHCRRAVVIGDRVELAEKSANDLLQGYNSREIGRFELPAGSETDHSSPADLSVLDHAIEFARVNHAEIILLALRWTDTSRRDLIRERLRILPLPVFLLPDQFASSILASPSRELGSQIGIEVQRAPLSDMELAAKRALDLILAAAVFVALLPLLALVSIAVKLSSPGPVIFRQRRHGFNRRRFTIYKFRTMNVQEDGTNVRQAQQNDDRVTPVGRLLRKTSVDELPQLVNVLRGDMSLVGPRPHACVHDDEYARLIGNYAIRHHIKPGITGLAQVNGLRGETAHLDLMKRRVDLDLWYINNWSFGLDLRIIARTFVELVRRTAY